MCKWQKCQCLPFQFRKIFIVISTHGLMVEKLCTDRRVIIDGECVVFHDHSLSERIKHKLVLWSSGYDCGF